MTYLSGCVGEASEETANAVQTSEITLSASETRKETESETEIKAETDTVSAEILETEDNSSKLPTPQRAGHDPRTGDYLAALADDSDFAGLCQNCLGAIVADMNGDGVPEVFLEMFAGMSSVTKVFTVKDGKAVCLKAAPDSYIPSGNSVSYSSYDGGLPEFYIGDGEKIILAKFSGGGSVGGGSGIMEISLDGNSISAKELCSSSYSKSNFDLFYSYRFGGEDVSEEEYQTRLDEYMSELDYCTDYSVTLTQSALKGDYNTLVPLADALDGFYGSLGKGDSIDFGVELKPIYVCISDGSTGHTDYSAVLSYDAMGNVSIIQREIYGNKDTCSFEYDYDDNGRVTKIRGFNNYTPEADYNWSIDCYGNIIKTRSNMPYTDMDESLYKFVTDGQGKVTEEIFYADKRAAEIYSYESVKVGDVLSRRFYRYDNFGNKIYEELDTVIYELKDSIQDYIETWEYDECNRLIKHVFSYGCDSIDEYIYNDDGDMVKRVHTFVGNDEMNGGKAGVYVTNYSYEKDLKGGVTCSYSRGSDYYDEDVIEEIYYAPVRTVK